ncbi:MULTISPECIES: hypothetical protein [Streptococcus]|uniref:hypothetical protein n=1 Tax=Streptococcus TaxID=1301 RepID=UPI00066D9F96|nr:MULTISPECIES: hypothetical protein [Streptococcus]MDN3292179.1 hypothetical protein [Streptococcus sp.]
MVKSLQSQFRDIERNMVREMNKMVKRANKKINPVILPTQVDSSMSALNFNEYHQDNSTHVSVNGDLINSQIGGQNNTLNITYTDMEIEKIFENIKEYSRTLDEEEKTELVTILNEVQEIGKVDNHQTFFEKHPILAMALSATVSWGVENGIDRLVSVISNTFK